MDLIKVNQRLDELMPSFPSKVHSEKLKNTLLSAVFNSMLVINLPDYTHLITPILRAYEYYLHDILGKRLGHITQNPKGKNNFSFFSKDAYNKYYYNKTQNILNGDQEDFLNDLYNEYNQVRHPYFHWDNPDPIDTTSVINDFQEAYDIIIEGLTVINKYYILFK